MGVHRLLCVLVLLATILAALPAEAAKKKKAAKPPVDRYASIVIEADSGYILSEKNADKHLAPASLTKMMTLYMTFEAIQQGRLSKNARIPVSKHAAFQEPSELGLAAGSTIRVEDAILGLVTKSANDAAVVLAEAMGGSESRFAENMTRRARQLGMNNTVFKSASGLHKPGMYSTARDMATLGQALVRDFPREYKYFSTTSFTYAGRTHGNHNKLLKSFPGTDGIKTGYVHASGYNLVASAKRDGTRLIGVVFGGKTSASRNSHMEDLLARGFDQVNDVRVAGLIAARQQGGSAVAIKKPLSATSAAAQGTRMAAAALPAPKPKFDAMGLVTEQGDTTLADDAATRRAANDNPQPRVIQPGLDAQPRSLNTQALQPPTAPAVVQRYAQMPVNGQPQQQPAYRAPSQAYVPSAPQPLPQPYAATAPAAGAPSLPPPTQMASAAQGAAALGGWSVQVGAFSSHAAGMSALKEAHRTLPAHITGASEYIIVPLMTNRGVIYRARLSGLDRQQASDACRFLQGSCLILASP